jgi:hypothetical protein
MLFSLEALEASHGDCLLLHYGTKSDPRFAIIDGGPPGVYGDRLKPRLEQLSASRADGGTLPVALAMVSHIDADHVVGILELTKDLLKARDDGNPEVVSIGNLWHNAFGDITRHAAGSAITASTGTLTLASADQLPTSMATAMSPESQLVLASVPQGRQLAANARKLGIARNAGFTDDLVIAPVGTRLKKKLGTKVTLSIVGPRQEQLDALRKDWAKKIAEMKKKGTLKPAAMEAVVAEFVDDSVYNLSSIVVLVECGKKSMLLTGDARGDYVLEGLEESGIKKPGKVLHVDILKMPHHGSWRNLADKFFREITADHYVISANGRDDNPDKKTIESLFKVRGNAKYTVHMTNRKHFKTGKELPAAKFAVANAPSKVSIDFADDSAEVPSIVVDLGDTFED